MNGGSAPAACPFKAGQTWYSFQRQEEKLFDSMHFVSLDPGNLGTWGEGYADLLRSVGDDVDSFFREMAKCPSRKCLHLPVGFTNIGKGKAVKDLTIEDYRKVFDPIYELSKTEIHVHSGPSEIPVRSPFHDFDKKTPGWWTAYNHIKHQYYEKMKEATLENVIDALGGLAILNGLHKCSQTFIVRNGFLVGGTGNTKLEQRMNPEYLLAAMRKSSIGLPASFSDIASAWLSTRMFTFELRVDPST
jgi:hypothetical protein